MKPLILALCVAAISAGMAGAQTPPKLTPEQAEKLKIREPMLREANVLVLSNKPREAIVIIEKVIVLERSILGETHDDVLERLHWLAELQERAGDIDACRKTRTDLLALRIKVNGKDHWQTTNARWSLGYANSLAGLTAEHREYLVNAKRFDSFVITLHGEGKFSEAIPFAETSLMLRRVVLGDNHITTALSMINLGKLYWLDGQYTKSEALYLDVLRIRRVLLGEKHPDYAVILNNLASLYDSQGHSAKAEPLFFEALRIDKEVQGEKHNDYANVLNNLAYLYATHRRYEKAEPLYRESLRICRENLPLNRRQCAGVMDNLAVMYDSLQKYAEAEPLHREALQIRCIEPGVKHPDYANSLTNLASHYSDRALFRQAEPLFQEALGIYREAYGEKNLKSAALLGSMALMYRYQKRYDEAESLYLSVLRIRKDILGEKHPEYAASLSNLASAYLFQGSYAKAEPLLVNAIQIQQDASGKKSPIYAGRLSDLAIFYALQKNYPAAEPLYQQAIAILQDYLDDSASIQSETDQLYYASINRYYLNNYLYLSQSDAGKLYSAVFRWHGAVTARQTFLRAASSSTPEIQKSIGVLQDIDRQMNRMTQNPSKAMARAEQVKLLKALGDQREALQKQIAGQSKDFAAYQSHLQQTPADLQKNLPEDTAVLDFLVHGATASVFVVTKKTIVRVTLKADAKLAEDIANYVTEASLKRTVPQFADDDVAATLRQRIWEPLEPHLKNIKRVLICPDGPFCRLPFAILPGSDPKKYLIEELAIVTVPVPQMLPELLLAVPPAASAPSLLAVGDVNFNGDPAEGEARKEPPVALKRSGDGIDWTALPASKREVEEIEKLFLKLPQASVKKLVGNAATEAAIARELPQHRFVHLATHGFFQEPKLVRNFDLNQSLGGETIALPSLPPGLCSGIVCAGANKPTLQDSGVMTALQIDSLDLRKVDLVVLSACDTGLGKLAGGEGVLGLQRAFQMAGVRTTISSLWSVPDRSTGVLMERFYENRLTKALPTAEALREAQIWVLHNGDKVGAFKELPMNDKRTPPIYWAAFTLAGDWR